MTPPTIRGTDERGIYLWVAMKFDGLWYSTGVKPGMLFVVHTTITSVCEYWIAAEADAVEIQTSWNTRSHPARVVTNSIAELAAKELGEPG